MSTPTNNARLAAADGRTGPMLDDERWRAVVETAVDAIVTIDEAGRIETFNGAAERLFGYHADEVVGGSVGVLMPDDVAREHDDSVRRYVDGGEARVVGIGREVIGRHRDGTPMALYLSVGELRLEARRAFVGILHDVRPEAQLRAALSARDAEYAAVLDAMEEGFVLQRGDGEVLTSNRAAERILGLTAGEIADRTTRNARWRAIRPDGSDYAREDRPAMVTLRTGEPVRGALVGIEGPAGDGVWLEVTTVPIQLGAKPQPAVLSLFSDVTLRRRAELDLREREQQLRVLAENATDLVLRSTPAASIVYASPAARSVLGYEPAALVGRRLAELLHPHDAERLDERIRQIDAAAGVTTLEIRMRHARGDWQWCEATVRAIRDATGALVERQSSVRSIEGRKRGEAALAESLGRYRALADHLPGGAVFLFDHDLRYTLVAGAAAAQFAAGTPLEGGTPADWLPAGVATEVSSRYRRALAGESQSWTAEHHGRTYDITVAPVLAGDQVAGGMALAVDVTDRARLEEEQAALHAIAHVVAKGAEMSHVLDLVATAVARLFGAVGAAVVRFDGGDGATVVASAPVPAAQLVPAGRMQPGEATAVGTVGRLGRPAVLAASAEGGDSLTSAMRALGAVGEVAAPVTIRGRLWGAVAFGGAAPDRLVDATAERLARFADLVGTTIASAEARQSLTRRAETDTLTQLANRSVFEAQLAILAANAASAGRALGIVVVDVDNFKQINDRHGHAVGDRVLHRVGEILAGGAREGDVVARIGGEEFGWLMPNATEFTAARAAERLRGAIAAAAIEGLAAITVSAGVTLLRSDEHPASALARADAALYEAKAAGRNTTRRAPLPSDPR